MTEFVTLYNAIRTSSTGSPLGSLYDARHGEAGNDPTTTFYQKQIQI